MSTFKPMLAATLDDPGRLQFPVLVSPKLDGLRCIIRGGQALSRNLKPFRNRHVQTVLGGPALEGLDGELIVGEPTGGHVLSQTQSGIMSAEGTPDFTFHVFDNTTIVREPFLCRFGSLVGLKHPAIKVVPHLHIENVKGLLSFEQDMLDEGYEGVMIRGIGEPYKFGRATPNEHSLFKFKRFRDGEATVLGVVEGTINTNVAERDNLGRSKRSAHQDNLVPNGRVGTIIAKELTTGQELQVSPGRMTHDMRQFYFENQDKILGRTITIKWFDYGVLNAPRFCTFQNFRDKLV